MAEVVPLLTPQGWQLITPVAASGAATGGAVGGATGLALAAGGGLILAVAFLVARRAKSAQSKTAGKGVGAAKKPAGGAGSGGRVSGLLSRAKGILAAGGRSGGGATGARSPAGGSGRSTGTGGARRGLGKLAGLGRGRGTGSAGKPSGAGRKPAGGTSSPAGGSKGAAPKGPGGTGLLKRLRGIGGGRNTAGGKGTPGTAKPAGGRPAGKGISRFIGGRKPTSTPDGKPSKGGTTGPAGEKHGKGIRGVTTGVRGALRGIGRASRTSKPGSFSPTTKRERLAAGTTAGGDTTPTGRRGTSAVARRAIDNATNTPVGKRRRTMGGPGMPILRRPTINKTGLARTGASKLGNTSSGPSPFAAVVEACGTAASSYSPENALRAIAWYEGMPELIEALCGMFGAHARKNEEDFYLYPAAAEIANALAVKFAAYKGPCEDARGAFESAHAEDLEKIRDPKPNQAKWDISANAG